MQQKLILENWRKYLKEVNASPRTFGDLQKIIRSIKLSKGASVLGDDAVGGAANFVINQIFSSLPIVSNAKSALELFKGIYDANDKTEKSNTWLDKLNVDDNYSKIVDDTIENAFVKELTHMLSTKNPQDPLPQDYDINKELEKFLKRNYGSRTLQGGPPPRTTSPSPAPTPPAGRRIDQLNEKKKKSGDRCTRIAKRKYDVWPSAYASGAVVKCRQGKIWKGVSENASDQQIDDALLLEEIEIIEEAKKKDYKPNFSKEKEQGLHGWFARNDGKGWVNCRTGGPCGRDSADKGGKYPACRPTKAQCKSAGKGPLRKKKSSSPISWTKKKKKD